MLKRSSGGLVATFFGLLMSSQSRDGDVDDPGNLQPVPMMAMGSGAILLVCRLLYLLKIQCKVLKNDN